MTHPVTRSTDEHPIGTRPLTPRELINQAIEGSPNYNDLGSALQVALHERDAVAYATIADLLGCEREDLDPLYREARTRITGIPEEPTPRRRGIRIKDLETLDYSSLELIFYGVHNLEVPSEMREALNPAEEVALYLGSVSLKRNGLNLGTFEEAIGLLDARAYVSLSPLVESAREKAKYTTHPGDQRRRLMELDDRVKDEFLSSYLAPYKPSDAESKAEGRFHDPNIDGRDRELYIRAIHSKLE